MKPIEKIWGPKYFFTVDANRTNMKPFPGKFPTRWKLYLNNLEGKTIWSYTGKPDVIIANKVQKMLNKRGMLVLEEFDQMGPFREFYGNLPRKNCMLQHQNLHVCYYYYPFHLAVNDFFYPWNVQGVHHKMGVMGERKFFFYAPQAKIFQTEAGIALLREQRTWLNKLKPWR